MLPFSICLWSSSCLSLAKLLIVRTSSLMAANMFSAASSCLGNDNSSSNLPASLSASSILDSIFLLFILLNLKTAPLSFGSGFFNEFDVSIISNAQNKPPQQSACRRTSALSK